MLFLLLQPNKQNIHFQIIIINNSQHILKFYEYFREKRA